MQSIRVHMTLRQLQIASTSISTIQCGPMLGHRPLLVAGPNGFKEVDQVHQEIAEQWQQSCRLREPADLLDKDFRSWQESVDLTVHFNQKNLDVIIGALQCTMAGSAEMELLVGAREEVVEVLGILLRARSSIYSSL